MTQSVKAAQAREIKRLKKTVWWQLLGKDVGHVITELWPDEGEKGVWVDLLFAKGSRHAP